MPLDRRRLRASLVVTFLGGLVFCTPIVKLSLALDVLGVRSAATIGAVSAAAAVATCAGAASFARLAARRGPAVLLPWAFALAAAGLAGLAWPGRC